MKDFDHLMSVWQGQPKQEHPSVDEVLKQVKKDIRAITSRMYWAIVTMTATMVGSFYFNVFYGI
jgi:hypothetical protein